MTISFEAESDERYVMKVVLLGDGRVGKTSLRKRYLGAQLPTTYMATIGADFAIKTLILEDIEIKFNIWDLAGQPRFREVRSMFFQGSNGAMFVFDLTDPNTLENLDNWRQELIDNCGSELLPSVIIGNKADLVDKVDLERAKQIAEEIAPGTPLLLTSAVTGVNVDLAFESIGKRILTFIRSRMEL